MNIQTFALQHDSNAKVTSQLKNILADTRPSLLIGYGNTDLPLEALASTISDTALSFSSLVLA